MNEYVCTQSGRVGEGLRLQGTCRELNFQEHHNSAQTLLPGNPIRAMFKPSMLRGARHSEAAVRNISSQVRGGQGPGTS